MNKILDFRERIDLDNLCEEIEEVINKYSEKLNYAELLGVLELIKLDAFNIIGKENEN